MENTVYISSVDKQETKIKGYSKLLFEIFDKKGKTDVFSTSTMSNYNLDKYIMDATEVLGTNSVFKNQFGVVLKPLSIIKDDQGYIVGLSNKNGLLLKNEVQQQKFTSQTIDNETMAEM